VRGLDCWFWMSIVFNTISLTPLCLSHTDPFLLSPNRHPSQLSTHAIANTMDDNSNSSCSTLFATVPPRSGAEHDPRLSLQWKGLGCRASWGCGGGRPHCRSRKGKLRRPTPFQTPRRLRREARRRHTNILIYNTTRNQKQIIPYNTIINSAARSVFGS
jgi:hypothetical protein